MTVISPSQIAFRHKGVMERDTLDQEELFPDDFSVYLLKFFLGNSMSHQKFVILKDISDSECNYQKKNVFGSILKRIFKSF